jgi:hypothetical protein
MGYPVIFFHGLSRDHLVAIMRAAKKAAAEAGLDPSTLAFASSTEVNLEWKVRALVEEVSREHEYMRKNPPPSASPPPGPSSPATPGSPPPKLA